MGELLALHHSSIDREQRECIEELMKTGQLRWIVCTSSLDLGIDFQPVEQVVQIGSPKILLVYYRGLAVPLMFRVELQKSFLCQPTPLNCLSLVLLGVV